LQPGTDLSDKTDAEWQRAVALYTAYDRDLGVADASCAIGYARALAGPSGKAGVMGFCLGGLMTFRTAALRGADAAVAYYGGSTENYLAETRTLRSPLLVHLAEEDEYMTADAQLAIRQALSGRPKVEVHGYPGCQHAFARRGGTHFDVSAATLANERTLRFFFQHLA
jgi:carboxymethylenebutenolidase